MVYDKVIEGKFVNLRSISVDDAEFSYEIRKDPRYCETVGQLASSLESQRLYIEKQRETPNDYYFVVTDKKNVPVGLIGIYDIHDGCGEFGREVNSGNPMQVAEAIVLLTEFCDYELHLDKICYVIYTNNTNNLSNQKKKGLAPLKYLTRNGIECAYFESELYTKYYYRVKKQLERIGVDQSD